MPPALKGGYIMANIRVIDNIVEEEMTFNQKELKEIEKAREMPIVFDDDCPEVTPEKAMKFHRVNPKRQMKVNS